MPARFIRFFLAERECTEIMFITTSIVVVQQSGIEKKMEKIKKTSNEWSVCLDGLIDKENLIFVSTEGLTKVKE